jgi:hypothetical protein
MEVFPPGVICQPQAAELVSCHVVRSQKNVWRQMAPNGEAFNFNFNFAEKGSSISK